MRRNLSTLALTFLVLAFGSSALSPANAGQGDSFVTAMSGNTLTGISSHGTRYYLYFLPGGNATYRAADGDHDMGAWHLDGDGNVCVTWRNLNPPLSRGCYDVAFDGSTAIWSSKSNRLHLTLRGFVEDVAYPQERYRDSRR